MCRHQADGHPGKVHFPLPPFGKRRTTEVFFHRNCSEFVFSPLELQLRSRGSWSPLKASAATEPVLRAERALSFQKSRGLCLPEDRGQTGVSE